jgi:glycosyltransferase involved in cell wall biosynthesis
MQVMTTHIKKTDCFRVLVLIPAYNEEGSIQQVVEGVAKLPHIDYLVINDGSKDSTSTILKKNNFNHIDLPVNLGLHGAVQLGIKYASENDYDCAIQFDGDGQHKAEYIDKLVDPIKNKECNVVIGSRFVDLRRPTNMRMLGSRLISMAIFLITRKVIKDPTSGMRAYDRSLISLLANNVNFGPEPDTIAYLLMKKQKVIEVQVSMDERTSGVSYLGLTASIKYMARMTISILLIQPFR